jgi:hypothetical protein
MNKKLDIDAIESLIDNYIDNYAGTDRSIKQTTAIKGRKRPDQSQRMLAENNPMYGKEHPNKGKLMPIISERTKGKKKPQGFGEQISKTRKERGYKNQWLGIARPEHSAIMKDPERNKGAETMRQRMICEHCGKESNVPNYNRWHGTKCKKLQHNNPDSDLAR